MSFVRNLALRKAILAPAGPADDKYSRGVVGFLTGSSRYPGAALLGVNSALAAGAGMVCFEGSDALRDLIMSQRPEVVLDASRADALVLGSGLDLEAELDLIKLNSFFKNSTPKVLDAGALEVANFSHLGSLSILTPHLREAERLAERLGIRDWNKTNLALKLARLTNQIVILKGSISQIASPTGLSATFGPASPHLATAGTGDVLAGILGVLLARLVKSGYEISEENLVDVSLLANEIHSLAAEISARENKLGASAIVDSIPAAISQLRG